VADAFSLAYGHEMNQRLTPRFKQNILRLDHLEAHDPAPGILCVAKEKHHKLLLGWSLAFVQECGIEETPQETEELVRRYIENRQFFIWEDRHPVAMAGFGGVTPNGVRVNMVYTDPRFRGRGYAGTLVHGLSRRLLADGHRFCCLFTDTQNPVAGRVYERLGYRYVCDFTEYR
jgi:predicted GNAT family acetyltransferase